MRDGLTDAEEAHPVFQVGELKADQVTVGEFKADQVTAGSDPVPLKISQDVYTQIASLVFDKRKDEITQEERDRARRAANEALFGEHAELVGMDRRLPGLTHLGQPTAGPSKELEAIEIAEEMYNIKFTSRELTAFCPVTGQPDFYEVYIEFDAAGKTIESKSLKLYLWSFRDEGCFAEDLAVTILNDIWPVIEPKSLCVKLTQNVRGGIVIVAQAERYRERIYAQGVVTQSQKPAKPNQNKGE